MPYAHPSCQLGRPTPGDSRLISPRTDDTQCPPHTLVRGTASQHIDHTASRRSGPRRWLKAVQWLIAAGLHPKANQTTMRIAEDLAARMDYDTGHVLYGLTDMISRTGISRAQIARHISYLRELGALAWVQHGTRTNLLAAMGLKGYKGTATVYAAVIPATYDRAMSHRIIGAGYTARIVIDQRGQQQPTQGHDAPQTNPVDTPSNPPVDNSALEGRETPSLTWLREESQVQVESGFNYTSQARQAKNPISHQSTSINGRRRTAADVRKAAQTVRLVRAFVNWTQTVSLRRLEYVLRPWTDRGWDAMRITDELTGLCSGMRWKPKQPAAFIRAHISKDTAQQQLLQNQQQAAAPMDNTEWAQWIALKNALTTSEPERTDDDRDYARIAGWQQLHEVADHYADDPDDALDLYGLRLCQVAISQTGYRKDAHV